MTLIHPYLQYILILEDLQMHLTSPVAQKYLPTSIRQRNLVVGLTCSACFLNSIFLGEGVWGKLRALSLLSKLYYLSYIPNPQCVS